MSTPNPESAFIKQILIHPCCPEGYLALRSQHEVTGADRVWFYERVAETLLGAGWLLCRKPETLGRQLEGMFPLATLTLMAGTRPACTTDNPQGLRVRIENGDIPDRPVYLEPHNLLELRFTLPYHGLAKPDWCLADDQARREKWRSICYQLAAKRAGRE